MKEVTCSTECWNRVDGVGAWLRQQHLLARFLWLLSAFPPSFTVSDCCCCIRCWLSCFDRNTSSVIAINICKHQSININKRQINITYDNYIIFSFLHTSSTFLLSFALVSNSWIPIWSAKRRASAGSTCFRSGASSLFPTLRGKNTLVTLLSNPS